MNGLADNALQIVRFLALSTPEMRRYLPGIEDGFRYEFRDVDGFPMHVATPSEACAVTAIRVLSEVYTMRDPGAFRSALDLVTEVRSVLGVMLDLSEHVSGYHWILEKEPFGIKGPYDVLWKVLRRLALQMLYAFGEPDGPPTLNFDQLIALSGGRRSPADG